MFNNLKKFDDSTLSPSKNNDLETIDGASLAEQTDTSEPASNSSSSSSSSADDDMGDYDYNIETN